MVITLNGMQCSLKANITKSHDREAAVSFLTKKCCLFILELSKSRNGRAVLTSFNDTPLSLPNLTAYQHLQKLDLQFTVCTLVLSFLKFLQSKEHSKHRKGKFYTFIVLPMSVWCGLYMLCDLMCATIRYRPFLGAIT